MSEAIFPQNLPGLKWGTVKTPMWSTGIQTAASGREMRADFYSHPLYKISLSYEVLRSNALAELQTMVGFFNARRGRFESFLYLDPEDNAVQNQGFGIVTAGQTQYQLVRVLGGYVEPVYAPQLAVHGAAPPVIRAAGVVQSGATVGADGVVTFASLPPVGAALTWSGGFFWRCRFLQDSADFERFLHQLWSLRKIELRTIKGVD